MLNYIGEWNKYGYEFPGHCFKLSDKPEFLTTKSMEGKVIHHDSLWTLLSRFNIMVLLANVTYNGRSVLHTLLHGDFKLDNPKSLVFDNTLELGCDFGHTWSIYKSFSKNVYGVEISDMALLGKSIGNNIVHSDMAVLPYDDNFFDLIVSSHALEHANITALEQVKEIYRVTKVGGWSAHILPCTPDNISEKANNFHTCCLNYKEWIEVFNDVGFTVTNNFFGWATNQEHWYIIAQKTI